MARAVRDTLERQEVLMVEAGTGVGKTLAYLLPLVHHSIEHNVRVAVSTETRSLQRQILEKDLPVVERVLGQRVEAEICMGASNYLCKRRFHETIRKGEIAPDMAHHMDGLISWEENSDSGLLFEYDGFLSSSYRSKISRDPDGCSGKKCPYFGISHYFRAREKWKNARLLILNHSLLASHLALDKKLLPEFDFLVIDEAHRFPEIFSKSFENIADFSEIDKVIHEAKISDAYPVFESFKKNFVSKYFLLPNQTLRLKERIDFPELEDLICKFLKCEKEIEDSLADLNEKSNGVEALDEITILSILKKRLSAIAALFSSLMKNPSDSSVHWVNRHESDIKMNYNLHALPLNTGEMIRSILIDGFSGLIFTSATLTTGDFKYFASENGCTLREKDPRGNMPERLFTLKLSSPFDYKNKLLIFLPPDMPDPSESEREFLKRVAEVLKRLIRLTEGGAFVLFTSNKSLKIVNDLINDDVRFEYRIFSQLEKGPVQALSEYLKNKNSVLFGVSTFWQGIDIPGDDLRSVVIVKLPFQVPDNPVLEARTDMARQNGLNTFLTLQLPHSIILMKQGVGRLIRKKSDRGMVALLDPRLITRSYGKDILKNLPEGRVIQSFEEIEKSYRHLFADGL